MLAQDLVQRPNLREALHIPHKTAEADSGHLTELQKRANRANQLVLFFLADANFWEKHAKTGENTRKQAKNRRYFGANFFWGKIGRC